MISWVLAMWDRAGLARRVGRLERLYVTARKMIKSVSATNDLVIAENRKLAQQVSQLEQANQQFATLCEQYERENKKVDPNAKCPNCGERNGYLSHAVVMTNDRASEVRPVNNCKQCGFTFCSSGPIAGDEIAARQYQPPTAIARSQKG